MVLCNCCKDCTKRHLRCHSTCEDYLNFRQSKDKENEQLRLYLNPDADMIEYQQRMHEKIRKLYR